MHIHIYGLKAIANLVGKNDFTVSSKPTLVEMKQHRTLFRRKPSSKVNNKYLKLLAQVSGGDTKYSGRNKPREEEFTLL